MEEIWKDIKGYENYQISNFGRVKSFKRYKDGKILNENVNTYGYVFFVLSYEKYNSNSVGSHRLVWDHFGNKPRNGRILQVDHIDNNKLNNRIDNLQLLTQRENTIKGYKNKKNNVGFYYCKRDKKYISQIRIGKERKILGRFDNEHDASDAYKKELEKI